MSTEEVCKVCGEVHGPGNLIRQEEYAAHGLLTVDYSVDYSEKEHESREMPPPPAWLASRGDNLDLLEVLRQAFHEALASYLQPDSTFGGPGIVYTLSESYDETQGWANEVFLGWIGEGAMEDRASQFVEGWNETFEKVAGGTDRWLVGFQLPDPMGDYGLCVAHILGRGYLYLPPLSETDGRFLRAWEPIDSRAAFEHAFCSAFEENALHAFYTFTFEPFADYGDTADITEVNVEIPLLAEAIRRSAVEGGGWKGVLWPIQMAEAPDASRIAQVLQISIESSEAALAIAAKSDSDQDLSGVPADVQGAVVYLYLRARGVGGDDD